jgi:hypothetical protein
MAAQIVLNEKKSTYGSPYGFYTVKLTPSGRTKDSVTVKCDVSAHLQYPESFTGHKVTCGLYIGGKWVDFVIYSGGGVVYEDGSDNGKLWKGTSAKTASKSIDVSGLSAVQKVITGIKFRAISQSSGGPQLNATACDDISIDRYGGIGYVGDDAALCWVNSAGEWQKNTLPWVNDNGTWKEGV